MPHLFISGHGGWKPAYGYASVPRGVSVVFYTHFAKNLITGMEYKILEGSYTRSDRVIGEFSQCPNMRASGQPDEWTAKSEAKLSRAHWGDEAEVLGIPKGETIHLNEIFEMLAGEMQQGDEITVHWLACSTLQLAQMGGRSIGLNAGDFQHDVTKPGRYRIKKVNGTYEWL